MLWFLFDIKLYILSCFIYICILYFENIFRSTNWNILIFCYSYAGWCSIALLSGLKF